MTGAAASPALPAPVSRGPSRAARPASELCAGVPLCGSLLVHAVRASAAAPAHRVHGALLRRDGAAVPARKALGGEFRVARLPAGGARVDRRGALPRLGRLECAVSPRLGRLLAGSRGRVGCSRARAAGSPRSTCCAVFSQRRFPASSCASASCWTRSARADAAVSRRGPPPRSRSCCWPRRSACSAPQITPSPP